MRAIAQRAVQEGDPGLLGLVEAVRFAPTQAIMFLIGLLLLAVGTALTAHAIGRSGVLPRWSGLPLAVGFALFLPQFYGTPTLRIAHGALLAVAGLVLAVAMTDLRYRGLPAAGSAEASEPPPPRLSELPRG